MSYKQVYLFCIGFVFSLSACNQDPTKDFGELTPEKPGNKAVHYDTPPFGLKIPEVLEFNEQEEQEFQIEAWANQGQAQIEVAGLPPQMTFDASRSVLKWNPAATREGGNPIRNPSVRPWRMHQLEISLTGSAYPQIAPIQKNVVLVIESARDDLKIQLKSPPQKGWTIEEDEDLDLKFSIQSRDFPEGPFFLELVGSGVERLLRQTSEAPMITQMKKGVYRVYWRVPCDLTEGEESYPMSVRVRNPRGEEIQSAELPIRVEDGGLGC